MTDFAEIDRGLLKARVRSLRAKIERQAKEITRLQASRKGMGKWNKRMREALGDLVAKLDEIAGDWQHQSVWVMHYAHGGEYTGPTYEAELEFARGVLGANSKRGKR